MKLRCLVPLMVLVAPLSAQARTVSLEIDQGTNIAVAASPNGARLVIDLQGTLWTLDAKGGRATAITDALGDSRQPSWSPDGSRIAFQSYRSGNWHVWTVGANGTGLEQITSGAVDDREPVWSPDGRSIAFSSDRSGNYDLWLVAMGETGRPRVRQLTRDAANDSFPSFSPDGKTLYFLSERDPKGVWRLELDSSAAPRLVAESTSELSGTSVSPDGSTLLVQAFDRARSRTDLVGFDLQAVDSGDGSGVGSRASSTLSPEGQDVFPFRAAWLSDDDFVYTGDGSVLRASRVGGSVVPIPFEVSLSFERASYERKQRDFDSQTKRRALGIVAPAVSPDGSRVVFSALGDLWLFEDGESRRLSDDPHQEIQPRWSPDGRQVVFVGDRGGSMQLWRIEIETGSSELVAPDVGVSYPVFSPSGSRLAYFVAVPGNPLAAVLTDLDLATGDTRALLPRPVPPTPISYLDEERVAVSVLQPDSTRYREGTYRIVVVSYDEPPRSIDPSPELTLEQSVFSPDGRKVAFVQEGLLKVALLDEAGELAGAARAVTRTFADSPSWTADSRSLVFLSGGDLLRLELDSGEQSDLGLSLDWQPEQPSGRTVVHAGSLFDGQSEQLRTDVDIVIEGNRIERVVDHDSSLHGDRFIDASGKTVIPGLFEMHAHQAAALGERLGRTWLSFGITSVREPGSNAYEALERRESWASGRRKGPREFFAGQLLDGSRVYYSVAEGTASPSHVSLALERARVLDYDLIKTYVRLPDAVQRRVAAYAHQLGIPTSSHEIYPAAASGMDAVEHIGATSRRGYSPKVSALGHSYDDVVEIVARSGLNQTPTLVLPGYFLALAERPELLDNRQYQTFYGAEAKATLARARAMADAIRPLVEAQGATPKRIVAAGGRITAGTDSPFVPYGFGLHIELQLLVRGGLEPWQVLRSATAWAAEAVGVGQDLGTIEAGKLADLVILRANPLEDIGATLEVETTIKNGRVYPVAELLEAP